MTLKEFNRLFTVISRQIEEGKVHVHKDTGEPLDLYRRDYLSTEHTLIRSKNIPNFHIWHNCTCGTCFTKIQLIKVVETCSEEDLWE